MKAKHEADCAQQLVEAIAFRDRWDVPDLDELIESLTPEPPEAEARRIRDALDREARREREAREKAEHDAKLAQVEALKRKLGLTTQGEME